MERNAELGISLLGLNRRSGIRRDSLSRVAATSAVISIEPLPAESRCEEKGIFSVKRTHLTKELSHDIASATHDRGHASSKGCHGKPLCAGRFCCKELFRALATLRCCATGYRVAV